MKFLTRITLSTEAGNRFIADKEFKWKMESILNEVKPESVYFCVENGLRTIYALVNVNGNHDLPRVAEPFWLGLKAEVNFIPAMSKDDFTQAAPAIENAVKKFNWS